MPAQSRPIITLTTDFGTRDYYVAAMKAVLVRRCPDVRMIDITHQVPRHDILCGSITLERAIDGFLPGTVHLAVVDPGVGTDRRILIVEINQQTVVCPDNGLITWAWRRLGAARAYELTWRPPETSSTFHGRDIMAPVAAMLACGTSISEIARPIDDPVMLDVAPASEDDRTARIIHIDAFGNATTNMDYARVRTLGERSFRAGGRNLAHIRRTYWDVAPGEPLALIGSSGLLEIAVRDGSACEQLNLRVGDEVGVE
jgi:S-adenosyl-L-methionine hydrolase (adenosine-forming)